VSTPANETPVSAETALRERSQVAAPVAASPRAMLPAVIRTMPLQARLDRTLVRAMPMVRYQFSRLGLAATVGIAALVIAIVAAGALLLPAQRSVMALNDQLANVAHLMPAPAQLDQTPQRFASTLPSRAQIPALLGTVMAQAAASGVTLDKGTYVYSPASGNRLARYIFEFPLKADYTNVRTFIDKSLTAVPALGLDKLHVERKNVADLQVQADVSFVIYLRGS
jgi:hypothetical protein